MGEEDKLAEILLLKLIGGGFLFGNLNLAVELLIADVGVAKIFWYFKSSILFRDMVEERGSGRWGVGACLALAEKGKKKFFENAKKL